MTQAPATTVATAVRQHGGGRHPLNMPCTVQAGRLQDSRGGVINRRAEGATSSNTLPASCAAAAHPTTGVRRARELSPSLRSQSCQHAQLVEGYTQPLLKNARSLSSQGEVRRGGDLHVPACLIAFRAELVPYRVETVLARAAYLCFKKGDSVNQASLALEVRVLHISVFGHTDHAQIFQSSAQVRELPGRCHPLYLSLGQVDGGLLCCRNTEDSHLQQPVSRFVICSVLSPLFDLVLSISEPNSREDCGGSSRSRGPISGTSTVGPAQRYKYDQSKGYQSARRRDEERCKLIESNPHHFLLAKFAKSLPALCHHVQRGAA